MARALTNAQLLLWTSVALLLYVVVTTVIYVWYSNHLLFATTGHRSILHAKYDFVRTHKEIAPQRETIDSRSKPGQHEEKVSSLSIRNYVEDNVGYVAKVFMSIISWNSDGKLETYTLRRQCAFRNYTEAATWPFLLNRTVSPSPHGVIALLPTTDYCQYRDVNWSAISPVPILTYTIPKDAAQNPWVRLIPTPYELKGMAIRAVDSFSRFLIPFEDRHPEIIYRGLRSANPEIRGKAFELGKIFSWLNATERRLPKKEMVRYRYLLDIGGISGTTWVALRW
eukprot:CAMPEP_0113535692 /NCGR_PEP_ID=MMETSP0015_2-20120614/5854_1 /TAXON_ID=2838 /ORGANISM="Odontella" /LENGTH=281 /DNA_ID=CAMNT_0000434989 /DNA_START=252 /DNA_END=1094 /DNA_ORIENTATION=+ /assembly_acc=CAM_ASM_000160